MTANPIGYFGGAGALAALVLFASAASSGELARESAYCVGALRHMQDSIARLGAPSEAQKQADALARRSVVVKAALGRDGLDAVLVRQLIAAGRADAEECWDQVDMCLDGSPSDLGACMRAVKPACLRTGACTQ